MRRTHFAILASAAAFPIAEIHADTFGTGGNTFTIEFVAIGNPGNVNDRGLDNANNTPSNPNDDDYASPFGGVGYTYGMDVTEVPQDWITKAINSGLMNVVAGAWTGTKPAANMTWYEAAAFVNWLNTSTGHQPAYNLAFNATWSMTLWSSADAWQLDGQNLFRHKDAYYFLPSEDEWYKAAYHKNESDGYWDYPTGSNVIPTEITSGTGQGTALYNNTAATPAEVDANGGLSPYGTRGQGGNVFEWVESEWDGINDNINDTNRPIRGGAWYFGEDGMRSSVRLSYGQTATGNDLGFRVASVIPEPSSALLLAASGCTLLLRRRR